MPTGPKGRKRPVEMTRPASNERWAFWFQRALRQSMK
jgi:hypothetical protein